PPTPTTGTGSCLDVGRDHGQVQLRSLRPAEHRHGERDAAGEIHLRRLRPDRRAQEAGGRRHTSTTTKYTYDPLDRTASRTEKAGTSNEKTTVFNYLGLTDNVISETNDLTGEIQKSYTYSPWGERLSQIKHGSSTEQSFYSYNSHTDVEALTDESGTPVATYGYTAYGKLDEESTTGKDDPRDPNYNPDDPYNVYRFNNKRWDPHTGKVDMGFRDYDPGLNRFLTRDMYNGALGYASHPGSLEHEPVCLCRWESNYDGGVGWSLIGCWRRYCWWILV
ncbi:RHS repeat-associated protein, partial [Planifilum fimeticola]